MELCTEYSIAGINIIHAAYNEATSQLRVDKDAVNNAQCGTVAVQISREMLEDAAFLCCYTETVANSNLPELESSSSRAD